MNIDKAEFIGNLTTIGKIIGLTIGTPAIVSFVNSNDFVLLVSAVVGIAWAIYDAKFQNTFFNNDEEAPGITDELDPMEEYEDGLNQEYSTGDEE